MSLYEESMTTTEAFFMSLSLTIALIMLHASGWIITFATLFVFIPIIFPGGIIELIVTIGYEIILRPVLYPWALVVTIKGEQDVIAIIFYVLFGLQIIGIVRRFILLLKVLFTINK